MRVGWKSGYIFMCRVAASEGDEHMLGEDETRSDLSSCISRQ